VPVTSGVIDAPYLKWMSWYDPDVVYSYADLAPATIGQIDRQCSPAILLKHNSRREQDDKYWATPDAHIRPIKAISFIPSTIPAGHPAPKIVACYPGWDESEIITDNFGLAESGNANGLYEPVTMTPRGLGKHMVVHGEQVFDEYELFEKLAKDRSIQSLSFYSSMETYTGIPIRSHQWGYGLNLFIGDAFEDRLHFWNSRHFNEESTYAHTPSFWLPEKYLTDDRFVEIFARYLNTWNHSFPNAQGWGTHVHVQSSSVTQEKIDIFTAKLKTAKCWHNFAYRASAEPIPDKYGEEPYYFMGYGSLLRTNENPAQLIPNEPKHFYPIPFQRSYIKEGDCAVDVALERYINHSRIVNKPHLWQLPRRLGITRLFSRSIGRVNSDNMPSFIYNYFEETPFNKDYSKKKSIEISSPEDKHVFSAAFTNGYPTYNDDLRKHDLPTKYEDFGASEKGRTLRGVLSIFGDLNAAYHFIENAFWRELVEELSSIKRITDNPQFVSQFKGRLQSELGTTLNISDEAGWGNLASKILPALYHLPKPKLRTSYEEMKGKRNRTFNKFLETAQPGQGFHKPGAREDIIRDFERSLKNLISMKVFFQGHEWQCRVCGHDNWLSVGETSLENGCEVCNAKQQIGVKDLKWDFLLNPKIAEALYKHDILAEIWVLGQLLDGAKDCFYFVPQAELFRKYDDKKPAQEIDIVCVQDGQLIIGEAKTKSSQFTEEAIQKLVTIAKDLSPDAVLIGYLQEDMAIADAQRRLQQSGFKVIITRPLPQSGQYNPWSHF
jgi:hypothetical protein